MYALRTSQYAYVEILFVTAATPNPKQRQARNKPSTIWCKNSSCCMAMNKQLQVGKLNIAFRHPMLFNLISRCLTIIHIFVVITALSNLSLHSFTRNRNGNNSTPHHILFQNSNRYKAIHAYKTQFSLLILVISTFL